VDLYPFDSDAGNYEFWDKMGQIVGNLTELKAIIINFLPHPDDGDDEEGEARKPDWETLTRILPHIQHKISLHLYDDEDDADVEKIQGLARAIHGHPMISEFSTQGEGFSYANLGPWCSALITLPSLESVNIDLQEPQGEDQRDLANFEPLIELLRTPALRCVSFDNFYFTNELCHATTNALEERSSIIDITFSADCSFPDGGRGIIANALKTNATVTIVQFLGDCDESFCNAMGEVLLCNSTLRNLTLQRPAGANDGRDLCPIFLSLGMNSTLKSLSVSIFDEFGDELCAAILNGLAKNSTLEQLSLHNMRSNNDDGALSAYKALSFLSTNSTLMSLTVSFYRYQEAAYISAFRLETVKMMENAFLESLTIIDNSNKRIEVVELLALISALQLNTTLKTLNFRSYFFESLHLADDEVKQLVSVLMKNFGLEQLVPATDDRTVKAIFRLNAAGRQYLIKDGSSISKGVDVLSAISDEIDCVFLHLLENPSLCDKRAAKATVDRRLSGAGKRERALSQPTKEAHRRLA
jgi:hypothetical protein